MKIFKQCQISSSNECYQIYYHFQKCMGHAIKYMKHYLQIQFHHMQIHEPIQQNNESNGTQTCPCIHTSNTIRNNRPRLRGPILSCKESYSDSFTQHFATSIMATYHPIVGLIIIVHHHNFTNNIFMLYIQNHPI